MSNRSSRRWWMAVIGAAALALALPALPSRAGTAAPLAAAPSSKLSPQLAGIVSHGLTDQIYGSVVEGHVPGTVYYLAKLRSVDASTLRALQAAGAAVRYRYDIIDWVALSSPSATVAAVAALPQVTRLTEDRVLHLDSLTATSATAAQVAAAFGDQSKRGNHDIGADSAWADGVTGNGVTVGVVDSGIDSTHADVSAKINTFVNCMGVAPDVVNDTNGVGSCVPTPGTDDNGHGTHVSGIAAGGGVDNPDLPGIAPDASLAGAKVCNGAGSCLNSSVLAGVLQLALPKSLGGAGADVINLSLGGGPGYAAGVFAANQENDADPEAQLIDALADQFNVVFAIAAGNAGPTLQSVGSPSTASQSISVGASVTDWDLNHPRDETLHGQNGDVRPEAAQAGVHAISTFSSRGPSGDRQIKPDLTAPGSYIVSAEATSGGEVKAADAAVGNNYSTDPQYAVLSGTSMASPAAAGAAALVIDGYRQSTGSSPTYYVVKAALANTAHGTAFEGPVTGLLSSIKSNRLGMDPASLFPPRNQGDVGVSGEGAGRVYVPDAVLASTAGVLAYTPAQRDTNGALTTDALQPSWALDDLAPGQTARQAFLFRGGPEMALATTKLSLSVESAPEVNGVHAAPASWFTLPSNPTITRGAEKSANLTLKIPAGAAPGQYSATVVGTATIGKGVTQHVRIPVQFFVPMPVGTELTSPIWASDTTDYSIVGFENPEGGIFTDWSMVPVRIPSNTSVVNVNVWDDAGTSTMDAFVFGGDGNEINSTVTNDVLHAVPAGAALQPTSQSSPGTITLTVGPAGTGDVQSGQVVWIVVSDTKPTKPATFETYHLRVS
ncbi:MAG TPA: S8 family serine peptidase [Acidimicrobiales bacterium]